MASSQNYLCHQCGKTFFLSDPDVLLCRFCNGDFVEEISSSHGVADRDMDHDMSASFNQIVDSMTAALFAQVHRVPSIDGLDDALDGRQEFRYRDFVNLPLLLRTRRFQNLLTQMQTNGTFVGETRPHNQNGYGDYVLGFEHLIRQLIENDPSRYEAPPASNTAIESSPTITITKNHMATYAAQCAVCKDEFEEGSQVKELPCRHLYHSDCIIPWLKQHNTCPVCRYELSTDELDCLHRYGASSSRGGFMIPRSRQRRLPLQSSAAVLQNSQDLNSRDRGAGGLARIVSSLFPWFRGRSSSDASGGSMNQSGNHATDSSGADHECT